MFYYFREILFSIQFFPVVAREPMRDARQITIEPAIQSKMKTFIPFTKIVLHYDEFKS